MKKMERNRAFFKKASRLYPQSYNGSMDLTKKFLSEPNPFEHIISHLTEGGDNFIISHNDECQKYKNEAYDYLINLRKKIHPYLSIPTLMQLTDDFYYPKNELQTALSKNKTWVGTATKNALAYIWRNVHSGSAISKAIDKLFELITACAVYEQLAYLDEIYKTFSEINDGISIQYTSKGFFPLNKNTEDLYHRYRSSFGQRGAFHRTVGDTTKIIRDYSKVLYLIDEILMGKPPAEIPFFDDTIFSLIPIKKSEKFWAGIKTRLILLKSSSLFRSKVTGVSPNDIMGVSLFEKFQIIQYNKFSTEIKEILQEALENVFWNIRWYNNCVSEGILATTSMIVKRPAVRLTTKYDLFATSTVNIIDSITWFVEASFMGYGGESLLSPSIFKKCISEPFEIKTCNLFRKHSFVAGTVSEKGNWNIGNQQIKLIHSQNEVMPGEIDILAYHKENNVVFIVECKVLSFPYRQNTIRNIYSKISEQDSEGFHNKLRKKIDWLKKTNYFLSLNFLLSYVGIIVLDRMFPGIDISDGRDFTVVSIDILDGFLESYFNSN